MTRSLIILAVLTAFVFTSCKEISESKYRVQNYTDKKGYRYESVTNDPLDARVYTLSNGLKVFLTVNRKEPRLQTFIAVKAGSTYDPVETTGLAHYLEHMMFKGTSQFGTTDWKAEKVLLDQISELYEQHKNTKNPEEKKAIYAKIDSISGIAAKYAIANEYDKMVSSIGAKGTNAYTSDERTVYMNDIPANELGKWLTIEKERFSTLVLRLFHTELETVYEEFNMGQDEDDNKSFEALSALLYQQHPYGTQTVIGKAEHLKNPSMINIHNYFNKYYVPNNMAISISGDLDFEKTIHMIDTTFGKLERKPVAEVIHPYEEPISAPREKSVYGPNPENLLMAFRFGGEKSVDKKMVTVINSLLCNYKAGLIDLNLIQKQKVLNAWTYYSVHRDYSEHILSASPRAGQKLEEVRDLLLNEIEKIKHGAFDDWMLEAVINNMKLQNITERESNRSAHEYVEAFTQGSEWVDYVKFIDELSKITKKDVVEFANKYYGNNYVAVYKRIGTDPNVVKVDKPKITPVTLNREAESLFQLKLNSKKSETLQPEFVDFEKVIAKTAVNGNIEMNYIKNPINELFQLQYIIDMGNDNNKKMELAFNYLPFLGTDKLSAKELQKLLYRYGLNMGVYASSNRSYVYISGIKKSFDKAVSIMEDVMNNIKPDQQAYDDYVSGILKERDNQKLDKNSILWNGLVNYGKYGPKSPLTNILSSAELKKQNPKELTDLLKSVFSYKHRIYYYGQHSSDEVKTTIEKYHKTPAELKEYPEPTIFAEAEPAENNVYFANFDMVQANIILLAKDELFGKEIIPMSTLFNEYYGGNMSSIVFQEIREARALAYSAFGSYEIPQKLGKSNYLFGFVATQADKLSTATDAMLELMNNMPKSEKAFGASTESIMRRIESERINNRSIFWNYQQNIDKGIMYDIRKDTYEQVKLARFEQLNEFFDKHVKNKKYTFLILGNRNLLDMKAMEKLGKVTELSLEQLFNY